MRLPPASAQLSISLIAEPEAGGHRAQALPTPECAEKAKRMGLEDRREGRRDRLGGTGHARYRRDSVKSRGSRDHPCATPAHIVALTLRPAGNVSMGTLRTSLFPQQ